jgi:hypothetical protein
MVDRIPPPPFWRTRYFAEIVVTKPDSDMTPIEIAATLAAPARREVQSDPVLALVSCSWSLAAGGDAGRWRNRAQRVLG